MLWQGDLWKNTEFNCPFRLTEYYEDTINTQYTKVQAVHEQWMKLLFIQELEFIVIIPRTQWVQSL